MAHQVGVQGIARDITEREEAARSLRESEARFRGLLESAPDAMIIIDQRGLIKIVNSQVERMFGYGRDELLGQPVERLLDESLHGAYATYRDEFTADPRARPMGSGVEVHARRRDGSQLPVEISLSPFLTDDGLVVTAAVRDVTEQRHAPNCWRSKPRIMPARTRNSSNSLMSRRTICRSRCAWSRAIASCCSGATRESSTPMPTILSTSPSTGRGGCKC